jgi:homoserine dehydrogenase
MGGLEPARTLVLAAIASGADVVTGNKALLANARPRAVRRAEQVGAQLSYEAAVGGAIPIIRPLRDSLAGDRIDRILGIVNGTTNFILDRMDTTGASLEDALATATELGLRRGRSHRRHRRLRRRAEGGHPREPRVPHERAGRRGAPRGHHGVTAAQVESARRAGFVVKLLAICERLVDDETGRGGRVRRVYPALVPRSHPLAAVHGANNAVFVEAAAAGPLMFYGAGAGGVQTASAVLGDLVAIARRHVIGGPGTAESTHAELPVLDDRDASPPVRDHARGRRRARRARAIAHVFAEHGVSVEQLQQTVSGATERATLVIGTHEAKESALAETVAALAQSPVVASVASVLRVEGAV